MAVTATTTQSRPPPPKRLAVKAVSVAIGVLLIGLSAPRLPSEFDLLIASSQPIASRDREHLVRVAATLEVSSEGANRARSLNLAAQARLAAAALEGFASTEGLANLRAAAEDQSLALSRAPIDAYAWGRLAQAEFASGRLLEAASAWRFSHSMGPFDPVMIAARTEAGIALWRYMDLDARATMRQALLTHRSWNADGLAAMIQRFGAHALLSQALRNDMEALRDIEARIRRSIGLP